MSREIKFRIWDGKKKEWLGSSDDDALTYYGFHLVGEVMTVQSPPQWALDEGMVVEQYTGVKDDKGVDIYEGDILRIDTHWWRDRNEYKKHKGSRRLGLYKVVFDEGFCAFCAENLEELGVEDINVEGYDYKILGNIHENPELLVEGKND